MNSSKKLTYSKCKMAQLLHEHYPTLTTMLSISSAVYTVQVLLSSTQSKPQQVVYN